MVQLPTDNVKETSKTRKQNKKNPTATIGSVRQAWRVIQIGGTWERGPDETKDKPGDRGNRQDHIPPPE